MIVGSAHWLRPALAVLVVAGVLAAIATWSLAPPDALTNVGALRLGLSWMIWTGLIAATLGAGVLRMAALNNGDETDVSPMRSLLILVVVPVICALSLLQAYILDGFAADVVIYGSLALAMVAALAIAYGRCRKSS